MRRTSAFVGWLLLAAAGAAAAQSPQQSERKAAPRESTLNLRLEEADLRSLSGSTSGSRDQPAEQRAADLPSLGGTARSIEQAPRKLERTSPYPENTNPGR